MIDAARRAAFTAVLSMGCIGIPLKLRRHLVPHLKFNNERCGVPAELAGAAECRYFK